MYGAKAITWRKDLYRKMDVFQNNMRISTTKRKVDRIQIITLMMMTRLTSVSTFVRQKTNMVWSSKKK